MQYGDITHNYLRTGKVDSRGREIGFAVVFRDNGSDFRCYVQNTRRVNGEWTEFGVPQRSRSFDSQAAATAWGYTTAHARIAKLN
jgi:hypothetical protein